MHQRDQEQDQHSERIAIVGISGLFPGAANPSELWQQIITRSDASSDQAARAWVIPPDEVFDPAIAKADKVYSLQNYSLNPDWIPQSIPDLALDPSFFQALDPLLKITLKVGCEAFEESNQHYAIDRLRTGVILGSIALPTESISQECINQNGKRFAEALGIPSWQKEIHPANRTVTGLPAKLLAQCLGLQGMTATLDAACSSSLYAIYLASRELQTFRADAMLAGGVCRPDSLYTQMGFAQLRALSISGRCSPFDTRADGLVVGEGAGIFVLKRLSDALDQGDKIYGVIAGIGISNDMEGNLLARTSEGQLRAMRQAYAEANWQPDQVDLIECHATGTPIGDRIEYQSLRELWRDTKPAKKCVIGSVKSTVGHLLTGAGGASLAKVLMAIHNQTLPPQTNFESAASGIDLASGPFQILSNAKPWERRTPETPRRAAVSGFGFGGINAHLLIEEWLPLTPSGQVSEAIQISPSEGISVKSKANFFHPIAIVGIGYQSDSVTTVEDLKASLLYPKSKTKTKAKSRQFPIDRFRIPPLELPELLPQQWLMLLAAGDALESLESRKSVPGDRQGVYLGLGLDWNTTNFHLRWQVSQWAKSRFGNDPKEIAVWLDAASPPLTANRTFGALASIAASRIARAFQMGGPSFTVSNQENSLFSAFHYGIDALQSKRIDLALIGVVDLFDDPRNQIKHGDSTNPLENSAAAIVFKRMEDIQTTDTVYAVIQGLGQNKSTDELHQAIPKSLQVALSQTEGYPNQLIDFISIESSSATWQKALPQINTLLKKGTRPHWIHHQLHSSSQQGTTAGANSLLRMILALESSILPPMTVETQEFLDPNHWRTSPLPQYWLRDHAELPRSGVWLQQDTNGASHSIVLRAYSPTNLHPETKTKNIRTSIRPLGLRNRGLFAFSGETKEALLHCLSQLENLIAAQPNRHIDLLAYDWWQQESLAVAHFQGAFHAPDSKALKEAITEVKKVIVEADPKQPLEYTSTMVFLRSSETQWGKTGKLAFVYPGSGNHFPQMGQLFGAEFPSLLDRQQAENQLLASQYHPTDFWSDHPQDAIDARTLIFGQVTLGTLITDLFRSFGIEPHIVLGNSLGESASLFGMRIWPNRDTMFRRIYESSLFVSDLAPPYQAARIHFQIGDSEPFHWVSGIVPVGAEKMQLLLEAENSIYLLIINSPQECVIGGDRQAVDRFVQEHKLPILILDGVTLAHCEAAKPIAKPYWELHHLPTQARPEIDFYSGVTGEPYQVNSESAADEILAAVLNTIDYRRVLENAYRDGARIFLEIGPGASCTRLIGKTLPKETIYSTALCAIRTSPIARLYETLAQLYALGVSIDLSPLYGTPLSQERPCGRTIELPFAHPPSELPSVKLQPTPKSNPDFTPTVSERPSFFPKTTMTTATSHSELQPSRIPITTPPQLTGLLALQWMELMKSNQAAQLAYLQTATETQNRLAAIIAHQNALTKELLERRNGDSFPEFDHNETLNGFHVHTPLVALDTEDCFEFAVGSIAKVLGPDYAEIDQFPTRVRLPDGPLMLVDRILEIHGEPLSLGTGRVITEHTVHADRWYLDCGRIPTCVAVESGQADLFLSGYLGIDLRTRGLAVYRLLDAIVTFHDSLPKPGDTIRYDISIDEFFKQNETYLFRFHFEGTVKGKPFLSMTQGCAGFFSESELASGRGIIHTSLDLQPKPTALPDDWVEWVPMRVERYSAKEIDALREGNYLEAFGKEFDGCQIQNPMKLPGGMLKLLDRVVLIDPKAGRYGLGMIRAEADIHPDDWFLTCHFVDDQVMPGTLMYECCLHTLRVYLMRLGWVGEASEIICEPIPEIPSRLKCRGQVTAKTRIVTYEIVIRELGYRPDAFAIADALMYADGKPIVEITQMTIQLTELTREKLQAIWQSGVSESHSSESDRKPAIYDSARILAFAIGKPSEAFGEPYRVFDQDRVIARLPAPPFQLVDRITRINAKPWKLVAGAEIEAQYDVPPDAWYFDAQRSDRMPFSVLLEIALQPCGWLAGYLGSALTSEIDLSFRNLGGSAIQHAPVDRQTGTLTITVTMTKFSHSGGMIIQHYDFAVYQRNRPIYTGNTYFGFFSKSALANQMGIREAKWLSLSEVPRIEIPYPTEYPFADARLQMLHRITKLESNGGEFGLGLVEAEVDVDPSAWFFQAHFHQDPVWPGSLGLESFLQLMKWFAINQGNCRDDLQMIALGKKHDWVYRGQILPTDSLVTVQMMITKRDDQAGFWQANGYLMVDGRIIYGIQDFTLAICR